MAKRNPNFFTFLLESPWWYSVIASLGGLKQIALMLLHSADPGSFAFLRDWQLQEKFKDTSHRRDINKLKTSSSLQKKGIGQTSIAQYLN